MKAHSWQMRKPLGVVTAIALAAAVGLNAGQRPDGLVEVQHGFGTGLLFAEELSPAEQHAYAMGVINGMYLAPVFGAPKDRLRWLEGCAENMTNVQVAAIIDKHLRDHPERWHEGLHIQSWVAMRNACGEG